MMDHGGTGAGGERRFPAAVAVTLRKQGQDQELLTSHVSYGGAFVQASHTPPMNSLVRLVFTLPPDQAKVAMSACVSQVALSESVADRQPGFGVRFVGLSGEPKERWERLIRSLHAVVPRDRDEGKAVPVVLARPSYVDRFLRKGRLALDLPLMPESPEKLARLVESQILQGTLFVPTKVALVVGAHVTVQLAHPLLLEETFPLEGTVRRRETAPEAGVMVELTYLPPEVRQGLEEFMTSVLVVEEYDVDIFAAPSVTTR